MFGKYHHGYSAPEFSRGVLLVSLLCCWSVVGCGSPRTKKTTTAPEWARSLEDKDGKVTKKDEKYWINLTGWKGCEEDYELLKEAKDVASLKMNNEDVTNKTLEFVVPHKDLVELQLSGTKVGNEGVAKLADLKKLEKLYLKNTKVTDKIFDIFMDHKNIKTLYLQGADIERNSPKRKKWLEAGSGRKALVK